ncbi:putative AMP-binding & Acyl-protein [Rosellinia necatrix]|uniref:Putative AMP-binding & Acyl-protein n=1 Tax=Rosellinia necatrix TaxID=77044 RepID=A0A1W2TAJ0_ROSNE|nr:putative AMP-binding & Acyl-protein [Rosellinia necatrix]
MTLLKLLPTAVQSLHTYLGRFQRSLHVIPPAVANDPRLDGPEEVSWVCLQDVLRARAESPRPKQLLFYPLGGISSPPKRVTYRVLYNEAEQNSLKLKALPYFRPGMPVLLHFEDHWDTVLWFWVVMLAGGVPLLSSPLSNVDEHRAKHLHALSQLLESPIAITRESFLHQFTGSDHTFNLHAVESLLRTTITMTRARQGTTGQGPLNVDSLAILMLTSGSSGNAKAVRLSHRQIIAAISGKASVRHLPSDGTFLNWISLDHVASLVEIHIQALWLDVDQIHVHAADVVASPPLFLDLLSRHRVSRSFVPNFFLAKLADAAPVRPCDLSNLTVLASGGEANNVKTCEAAAALLTKLGASPGVITPGYGMTETCAGAIFNLDCPRSDVKAGRSIASVGRCMPGINMRIIDGVTGQIAGPQQPGCLEVSGAVVFQGYFRNPAATAEAFTPDGWFRTGDEASIDAEGNLSLIGRVKDVININGNKIVTAEIQSSVEAALKNTSALRIVCFASRASTRAVTEQVTIAYISDEWPLDAERVVEIDKLVAQGCRMVTTACQPMIFGIGVQTLPSLPITALGKISRVKMQALFESGAFEHDIAHHREVIDIFTRQVESRLCEPLSETETLLRADIADIMAMTCVEEVGVETNIFQLGFTSMDIIRLKHRLDTRLGITVATIVLMQHPTVRSLAAALISSQPAALRLEDALLDAKAFEGAHEDDDGEEAGSGMVTENQYDPVVVLRSSGSKAPLWLVHPGVGEVLVFVGLAQHMGVDDRPVYALRARGFEPGQCRFTDIDEAVGTYVAAVRRVQPRGPYALAGYSYGTMLAFEMAKRLGANDAPGVAAAVKFLGSFNLPPHIKLRMRQLSWNMCLLHLAQFLGLVPAALADEVSSAELGALPYHLTTRDNALAQMVAAIDGARMHELGLDRRELARWVDVAHGLQSMAVNYEPSGLVPSIDVFHAEPLRVAAPSREAWVTEQLSRWCDFSRSKPRFHEVGGAHYTMLGSEHVAGFADKLRVALRARGV